MKTKKDKEIDRLKKELNTMYLRHNQFVFDLYFSNTTDSKEQFEKVWSALTNMGFIVTRESKRAILNAYFKSPIFISTSSVSVTKRVDGWDEEELVPIWEKKNFETVKDKQKFLRSYKKRGYQFIKALDYYGYSSPEPPSKEKKVFTYFNIQNEWTREVMKLLSEYQESHFYNDDKLSKESDCALYHKSQSELVEENRRLRKKLNESLILPQNNRAISSILWDFERVYKKLADLNTDVTVAKMNGIGAESIKADDKGKLRWKKTGKIVAVQDGDIVWDNARD